MSNIRVRIRNPETIRARLRPQQGIKVGNSNKYLFDPDLMTEYVEDARDWAIKTDGLVDEEDYSSKAWAIGGTGTETNNSKYWAEQSATSASNASTSETNAGLSATSASNSASTATTQAGIATTQAGIATTKASEASNSASTATTQAGIATTKAGEASTSATNASNSESNALTYSNNASNSATSAGDSATTATTQAGIATTQAGLSKQWAIGEPTEPAEGSAKYWAEQAAASSGLPVQTGKKGKYLTTDGSDASWEYIINDKGLHTVGTQYYPGDIVQKYDIDRYKKFLCIEATTSMPSVESSSWLLKFETVPYIRRTGEYPILSYERTSWTGDVINSIQIDVPRTASGYANQPTINTTSGLMKVPGGIDGYSPDSAFGDVAFSNDYGDLDNLPNYGAGLSYSSSSLQLLDQNGNNLGSPVTIKSTPDLDGVTIDTNSDDELEAIGTVNKNTAVGATAVKYDWIGTLAEYNAQNVETLHPEWVCYITDDVSGGISVYTKAEVDSAISTALTTMLDSAFPVGSRYITEASNCPLATLIPNSTWVLTSQGRVIQGADSNHASGTTAGAGLPNITGSFDIADNVAVNSSAAQKLSIMSGAFTKSSNTRNTVALNASTYTIVSDTYYGTANFSASDSNSIYGNSTTVQPPAEFVNIFKRTA